MRRLTAAVIVVAMSGCSFIYARPSPQPMPIAEAPFGQRGWTSCPGYGWAVADAFIAMFLVGLGTYTWLRNTCEGPCEPEPSKTPFAAELGVAGVLTASAAYGAVVNSLCNARIDDE